MGPKHKIDADFAWILVEILFLLIKLNYLGLFHCEISNYWIFKNISSPGKKVSKSRYRDASRRLRNAGLGNTSFKSIYLGSPITSNKNDFFKQLDT